ncbi:hypothetical protein EDC94DRAFT_617821 [Helicostylum pulchrum]|nr:hypothetical protein EDC94DRAFT_617821 [Helicostylum pulchrum]
MDSSKRWSKRPNSTISQRNVDKELQRIKSLAVVSVLNKNFSKETGVPLSRTQAPSPSSSLTTDDDLQDNSSIKNRSRSISHNSSTSEYSLKKSSNASLHAQYTQSIPSVRRSDVHMLVTSGQEFIAAAEKESNEDSLVISSPIDIDKEEALAQRIHELQDLYNASIEELKISEARNETQSELVLIQDKLIQNMSCQLDSITVETTNEVESSYTQNIQLDTEEGRQAFYAAQNELQSFKKELLEVGSLKDHYETIIFEMTQQISAYSDKMVELERVAMQIKKENASQVEYIDTKVQTLVNKLLETNETINRIQIEHIQEKQALTKNDQINNGSSIKSLNDSSSVIWETYEEDDEPASARSSYISVSSRNEGSKRKSFLARWKGNSIPPAAPPPSLPLPPIPSTSSRSNRPKSTLSELYASSSSVLPPQNKHVSMDAVGGGTSRRLSTQSELESQMSDAAYYKEFTDQLQERLSVSKEIDDLRVWEPSDYNEIQKKIDSKGWSGSEDGNSQKDQSAFWKGMKKKLRA